MSQLGRLNAAGGYLAGDNACKCREVPIAHYHRWQIVCNVCGFVCQVPSARTYELPDHTVVNRDGDMDDAEVQLRLGTASEICMGSGFRMTARLVACLMSSWLDTASQEAVRVPISRS